MILSILTPTFHPSDILSACLESVMLESVDVEREGGSLEHHVQDGGGDPATLKRLSLFSAREHGPGYRFTYASEHDGGMYDALTRALGQTTGEIIGHLNADEQYQPGALLGVYRMFEEDPTLMVLSGGVVITKPDGAYVCTRLPFCPSPSQAAVCPLPLFTCATFYRREVIPAAGGFFDLSFRSAGDAEFFHRILRNRIPIQTCPKIFALFIDSGDNLALSSLAQEEKARRICMAPRWQQLLRPVFIFEQRLRKLVAGVYRVRPHSYRFLNANAQAQFFTADKPEARWKRSDS